MLDPTEMNERQRATFNVVHNPSIAQVAFNSFGNSFTASEFITTLLFAERPLITLIMAPAVAKSFALSLIDSVKQYEEASQTTVLTVNELAGRIEKFMPGKAE